VYKGIGVMQGYRGTGVLRGYRITGVVHGYRCITGVQYLFTGM
jgi:hypothetical protein